MEEKAKALPVCIRANKGGLGFMGEGFRPTFSSKKAHLNPRWAARAGDAGEQPPQFGISDSQLSLAQAKMPLRNLPRRSEVSEHHVPPKASALAVHILSMVK